MPKVTFLLQGLDETKDHYSELDKLLKLPNISTCLISVAFMNASGASLITGQLASIADKLQFFIGICNGVTSKQGIQLLRKNNICPICVDTATQEFIFHPKVYYAQNADSALLITGSANLTSGGLVKNIEASLMVNLDLSCLEDVALAEKVISDFTILKKQHPENVFRLDNSVDLNEMVRLGLLEDETLQKATIKTKNQIESDQQTTRPRMKLLVRKLPSVQNSKSQASANTSTSLPSTSFSKFINNQLLWKSGQLKRRDLNIPTKSGTHPTGSMLLKVGDPSQKIDPRHYFRDVVFASASWSPNRKPKYKHIEACTVKFQIIIKGFNYGIHPLKLSHNTRTDTKTYKQKNSTTQIHWGEKIKPLISQEDLLGGILCIYAPDAASDVYTLTIDVEKNNGI